MRAIFKLAAGIFLGLFAFVLVMGALQNLASKKAMEDLEKQMQLANQHQGVVPTATSRAGEKLASGEECVSGTVVRRSIKNGVPTAEQVLENYRPIPCAEGHRL